MLVVSQNEGCGGRSCRRSQRLTLCCRVVMREDKQRRQWSSWSKSQNVRTLRGWSKFGKERWKVCKNISGDRCACSQFYLVLKKKKNELTMIEKIEWKNASLDGRTQESTGSWRQKVRWQRRLTIQWPASMRTKTTIYFHTQLCLLSVCLICKNGVDRRVISQAVLFLVFGLRDYGKRCFIILPVSVAVKICEVPRNRKNGKWSKGERIPNQESVSWI